MKQQFNNKTYLTFTSFSVLIFIIVGFASTIPYQKNQTLLQTDTSLINTSEKLLYKIKLGNSSIEEQNLLEKITFTQLRDGLNNDDAKKAFWINIYNAYYQILANDKEIDKSNIFTIKAITIANTKLSLDNIEHGILRKYRWKFSMGYLPHFFISKKIKQLAVNQIDFRIHFALNRGAKSCPPIAFYSYSKINQQLDLATTSFLQSETEFNDDNKILKVSKIMSWFLGDFNGKNGIRKIITEYLHKNIDEYSIKYKPYNWDADLNNFAE